MKIIVASIGILVATSWSAFGKAYFFTRTELIDKASVIAIVSIDEPMAAKPPPESKDPFVDQGVANKNWDYAQQAKVRVEKTLKGEPPKEFTLYGKESFICAQCLLSKGKFLVFLTKNGEFWSGVNWQISLRPIRDRDVEWYVSDEQRFPMTFQKLDDVVHQIETMLKKSQTVKAAPELPATRTTVK